MAKHSIQYHIKQLDKIAKTGIVPDEYKNIFRDVKNPQAQIKKAISDINKIDRGIHEEHIKKGIEYDDLCFICNPSGKKKRKSKKKDKLDIEKVVEEKVVEEKVVEEKVVEEKVEPEEIIEEVFEEKKDDWENGW